ncbi:GNAT family N-acetyltransferase [Ruegeria sp. R13_0]|uniref:GNAT family N-acetyltransferase n=1 Tax=Ruegeria sp. R13_0 TaxID=2821099 RepID=UPI001ADCF2B9|nr:GNAT family N-acetyltransferase [Ruegeria sp. R13_0]MBO9433734.1 GNAT family N-acetyltransferase [Ruegeria sp. R13_0]
MSSSNRYTFRKMTSADFEMMSKWRSYPHVREWWDSDEPNTDDELVDARVERWIVSLDQHPVAYMQDYTVHGWEDHHFFSLPPGSRGVDQFIGEPDMIGRGHGPAFISEHVNRLFARGAPVVATDPHPKNARAIAAYKKAGFTAFGPVRQTPWGPILPMKASP